ncbi:MAG: enoyl-CoA hydratase [Alphaproteobacteria bacterium]
MPTSRQSSSQSLQNEPVLLRENRDGIAYLTLNRPAQFNVLSENLLTALQETLDALKEDRRIRIVVLAGSGKAFCAGHDLKEMRARPDKAYYRDLFARCGRMMQTLSLIPQPVIASVHGIATAAGCQLVAACDLAVASEEARFATSGINIGLFCSTPAVPLSRSIGRKAAFEMLLTGDFVDAKTVMEWGLINRVVPTIELQNTVYDLAQRISRHSNVATSLGKKMFYKQLEQSQAAAYDYAAEVMAENMMAKDVGIGIDAFTAKKKPTWSHS